MIYVNCVFHYFFYSWAWIFLGASKSMAFADPFSWNFGEVLVVMTIYFPFKIFGLFFIFIFCVCFNYKYRVKRAPRTSACKKERPNLHVRFIKKKIWQHPVLSPVVLCQKCWYLSCYLQFLDEHVLSIAQNVKSALVKSEILPFLRI